MNYDSLEEAMAKLVENVDHKHYPVKSMALEHLIWQLDRLMEQVKEVDA